jgi:hypothetical protein
MSAEFLYPPWLAMHLQIRRRRTSFSGVERTIGQDRRDGLTSGAKANGHAILRTSGFVRKGRSREKSGLMQRRRLRHQPEAGEHEPKTEKANGRKQRQAES